jgi:hypothetical protein
MSLRERILAKKIKEEIVTVDGDDYLLIGLSTLDKAKCFSEGRDKKGVMPDGRVELNFLEACVRDPSSRELVMNWKEWQTVPSDITGPIVSRIRQIVGLDAEDLGKKQDDTSETAS